MGRGQQSCAWTNEETETEHPAQLGPDEVQDVCPHRLLSAKLFRQWLV